MIPVCSLGLSQGGLLTGGRKEQGFVATGNKGVGMNTGAYNLDEKYCSATKVFKYSYDSELKMLES